MVLSREKMLAHDLTLILHLYLIEHFAEGILNICLTSIRFRAKLLSHFGMCVCMNRGGTIYYVAFLFLFLVISSTSKMCVEETCHC
jgi:hypothetical protein